MVRVAALRVGYASFGLALLALAGSYSPAFGWAVLLSPVLAFVGAVALAFSDDPLPKWAGVAFLVYAAVTLVAFFASTPATIRLSFWKGFANPDPHPVADAVREYLVLALPVMACATALAAAWEREHGARLLLAGGLAGLVLLGVLTVTLKPPAPPGEDVPEPQRTQLFLDAEARARAQGRLLQVLLVLSAAAGAAGAIWSAARPDEYH